VRDSPFHSFLKREKKVGSKNENERKDPNSSEIKSKSKRGD
jgi:hypothetical protein